MRLLLPLAQACTHTFINTDVRRNDMPACEAAEALASSAKMLNGMGVGWKRAEREGKVSMGKGSVLVLQLVGQPVQALVQTVSASRAGCLDVPIPLAKGMQA